jgi:hypothetical protein
VCNVLAVFKKKLAAAEDVIAQLLRAKSEPHDTLPADSKLLPPDTEKATIYPENQPQSELNLVTMDLKELEDLKWRLDHSNKAMNKALETVFETKQENARLKMDISRLVRGWEDAELLEKSHTSQVLTIKLLNEEIEALHISRRLEQEKNAQIETVVSKLKDRVTELETILSFMDELKMELAKSNVKIQEEEARIQDLSTQLEERKQAFQQLMEIHNTVCANEKLDLEVTSRQLVLQKRDGLVLEGLIKDLLQRNVAKSLLSKKLHESFAALFTEFRELTSSNKLQIEEAEASFNQLLRSKTILEELVQKHLDIANVASTNSRIKILKKSILTPQHINMTKMDLIKELQDFDTIYEVIMMSYLIIFT